MAEVTLQTPLSESDVRKLALEDTVYINGHIFGIRDATQIRIFDEKIPPPTDLTAASALLARKALEGGLNRFTDTEEFEGLMRRVAFAAQHGGPDPHRVPLPLRRPGRKGTGEWCRRPGHGSRCYRHGGRGMALAIHAGGALSTATNRADRANVGTVVPVQGTEAPNVRVLVRPRPS